MKLKQLPRHLANLVIILAFLAHAAWVWRIPVVQDLEHLAYDFRLRMTMPETRDDRIVILDIDERSLQQEGRWPWPRERLSYMIDLMFDYYGIGLLAFDVVFSERDESSGLPILHMLANGPLAENPEYLDILNRMSPELDYDGVFARSLQGRNVIMGWFGSGEEVNGEPLQVGVLPDPIMQLPEPLQSLPLMEARGFGGNLPELQAAARSGGFFHNPVVDADGKFRRFPVVVKRDGALYGSLSLEIVRAVLGDPELKPILTSAYEGESAQYALEGFKLGNLEIPTDHRGAMFVPYLGRQGSFQYIPITDVLNAQVEPEVLQNAVVIVGTTAAGLLDLRSTPVQNVYPGVEIQANLVSGILDQRIKHRPAYVQGIEFLTLLVLGLLFALIVPRLPPTWSMLATVLAVGGVLVGNFYAWSAFNLATDYAMVLVMVLTLIISDLFFGFFLEMRDRRRLSTVFGHYVPPELVEEMSENPGEFSLEGESRDMTVLFSDVRGFTTLSEGLNATELTKVMNSILTPMTRVIHEHRGTIDKYMGDCIMAFWGAPLADEQHARHAVKAGLELIAVTDRLRSEFRERGWPPVRVGVGANTGQMSVGNMGSEFRMAYTVMGDSVNLGSRVEGLTKQYGVDFIVTEYTVREAAEFAYRELDRVRVKGKQEPVVIHEPVGLPEELSDKVRESLDLHHQALELYRTRDWAHAHKLFRELRAGDPETLLYTIYLDRIEHFRANAPDADWDGVYTHTSK